MTQGQCRATTVTSGFNNTTDPVQVTVASTKGFFADKYVICEAEVCLINSVDDTTKITVARAQLGTAAASHANASAIYQLGASIPLSKMHLLVPSSLRTTANVILFSERLPGTLNNDYNPYAGMAKSGELKPLVVPDQYLGSSKNWMVVGDKAEVPVGVLDFYAGRQEPEIFLQDQPTVGEVFNKNILRYQVRHEYAVALADFRGIVVSIAP